MTIINAAHLSEIETARPRRYYGRHTHASDAGRGLSVCGRRGVPVETPGQPVTCSNCLRRLAAQARQTERRAQAEADREAREPAPIPGRPPAEPDAMRAAGWKRRPGDAKGWRPG